MARPGGPWWWKARGRWAATIGGGRRVAPKDVEERDKSAAWAWYSAEAAEAARPRPATTFAGLCNLYLARLAERAALGQVAADTVRVRSSDLTVACGIEVDGVKLGSLAAADVDGRVVRAMAAAWARRPGVREGSPASSATVAAGLGAVRTMVRWAWRPDDGREPLIPADPFAGFRMPRSRPAEVEICGRAEAAAWLRWCRREARDEVGRNFLLLQRALVATGARPGEFFGATWGEVAWSAGSTASGAAYGMLTRREWKNARRTGKPRRIVLLPNLVRPLRRLYERSGASPGDLIFRAARGGPWRADVLAQATARVRARAKAAGVDLGGLEGEGPGRARGYLWRHAAASRLVAAGVDLLTAADLLGTSPAMIARTYGHVRADRVVAAAGLLTSGRAGSGRRGGGPSA